MLTFTTIFGVEIMKLIRSRSGSSLINQIDNSTIASRKGDSSGPNLGIFLNIRSSGMDLNTRIVLENPALINQIRVVAFNIPQLTQASFLQKI